MQNQKPPDLTEGASSSHQLLTMCPKPKLDWSRDGTPASDQFGDIYFSVEGGLEETQQVYLKACALPVRWDVTRGFFTIAELGFGTGLNFLATWKLWDEKSHNTERLHFISVEKYPLDKAELKKALEFWPVLKPWSKQLVQQWPGRVKGTHRLEFGKVTLTLIHDDVKRALLRQSFQADAWFLDGFSPARNPDMWSSDVLGRVGELSAGGARVGTFTAAGSVRTALKDAGFDVKKVEGFGRKRHRIEAIMPNKTQTSRQEIRPVIIGAGIAGASLVRSFMKRGIMPIVIDAGTGTAASGNPAAIIKPRLDRQDKPDARFFLSSYLYALNVYNREGAVLHEGVFHAAINEALKSRFQALVKQSPLPADQMMWQHGPFNTEGLYFPKALIIDPIKTLSKLMQGVKPIKTKVKDIQKIDDVWHVMGRDEQVITKATHVICAMGAGVRDFSIFQDLGLRFSRGQLTWVEPNALDKPISYGGYAIPMQNGLLIGATHDRLDGKDIYEPRAEDDEKNIEAFEKISKVTAKTLPQPSRVSVRVNTPQTWPVRYNFGDDLWGISGLGSRGFVSAPLLSEAIVSEISGEPSPIETDLFLKKLARKKAP